MMNNFVWTVITLFRISGASQAYFGSLKFCYQRGYYCRERLYSQISLKVWDSEEKLAFSSRLPLRRHIARLGTFSVDPGIVVSFYASAHHPYTTLAIDEWMIFWPAKTVPLKLGRLSVAAIMFSSHPYRIVRLLVATLQFCWLPVLQNFTLLPPNLQLLQAMISSTQWIAFCFTKPHPLRSTAFSIWLNHPI